MYEMFFRSEPGQFMNKPRFMIAMRQVFGFQTAHVASGGRALWTLERTYSAFDVLDKGAFDWRLFLVMYRVVHMPLTLFRDHLVFGFGVFASSGSYDYGTPATADAPGDCGVRHGDVRAMFGALTSQPLRALLLDLVETAWLELAEISTQLNIQVQASKKREKCEERAVCV